jgi:hypothetical protein
VERYGARAPRFTGSVRTPEKKMNKKVMKLSAVGVVFVTAVILLWFFIGPSKIGPENYNVQVVDIAAAAGVILIGTFVVLMLVRSALEPELEKGKSEPATPPYSEPAARSPRG